MVLKLLCILQNTALIVNTVLSRKSLRLRLRCNLNKPSDEMNLSNHILKATKLIVDAHITLSLTTKLQFVLLNKYCV